ncbi:MAG TPA: A/G-specific adenine glycosylase [Acidothermaceae bacterium]|nr:A/G-specific adenine glycosylase [Acidothermaceae bacterium]
MRTSLRLPEPPETPEAPFEPIGQASDGTSQMVDELLRWYAVAARELPWRDPAATPWAVLVSEIMLQQTPVARVLPAYAEWIARWPTPAALAAAAPGDAVRAWGRLGYPRRALRLHAAATTIVASHGGAVPADYVALRALPGIGDYTAAAVAAFAFRQRHAVLDTNVRRVLARALVGLAAPSASVTVAERKVASDFLPDDGQRAARVSVALMELGALICKAGVPDCVDCPIADRCQWRALGYPKSDTPLRRAPGYEGSDRQARGAVLAVLRSHIGPVSRAQLRVAWLDDVQRERALDGLVADGLVEPLARGRFRLPT